MGRELARQLAGRGLPRRDVRRVRQRTMAQTQGACARRSAARARASRTHARRRLRRGAGARVPRRGRARASRPIASTCCSTTRASAAAAASSRDERDEWEKTLRTCAGAACTTARARSVPLLLASRKATSINTSSVNGFWATPRPDTAAHRVQRSEVRGEGLHRGADQRLPRERAAREGVARDAGSHRHVDHHQLRRASSAAIRRR